MRKKIIAGLLGLELALNPGYLGASENKPAVKTIQPEKKSIDLRQEGIERIIRSFTSEYLKEGAKSQLSIREAIQNHGLEKVAAVYNSAGVCYLSLARERVDNPGKCTPEQIDKKCLEISDKFMDQIGIIMNHTPIDYAQQEIRKSYALWVRHKSEFYIRLLSADADTGDYSKLLKQTFSAEEYRDLLKKEIVIIGALYYNFIKFRTGVKGVFAAEEIDKDRNFQIQFFRRKSWEYYPEAKPKEENQK